MSAVRAISIHGSDCPFALQFRAVGYLSAELPNWVTAGDVEVLNRACMKLPPCEFVITRRLSFRWDPNKPIYSLNLPSERSVQGTFETIPGEMLKHLHHLK